MASCSHSCFLSSAFLIFQVLSELGISGRPQSDAFARMFGATSAAPPQQVQAGPAPGAYTPTAGGEAGGLRGPAAELFEVPCHVLPPMRTLVSQFMDAVLAPAAGRESADGSSAAAMVLGDAEDDDVDADENAEAEAAGDAEVQGSRSTTASSKGNAIVADPAQVEFMLDFWAAGKPVPMPAKAVASSL